MASLTSSESQPIKWTDYFFSRGGSNKRDVGIENIKFSDKPRARLREVAKETLLALEDGKYIANDTTYDLEEAIEYVMKHTKFFAPNSLSSWDSPPSRDASHSHCTIKVVERTTLSTARELHQSRSLLGLSESRIGVLNFASAKKEGGGFIIGARAQEETLARASTLFPSLMSAEAQQYYELHRSRDTKGYYSHAMIYSPKIQIIRSDDMPSAEWHPPVEVDMITAPAANAGVVLGRAKNVGTEKERIREVMTERMARILFLFEQEGVDALVLGSFGTGAFKNDVETIASIWKSLLEPGGRFARSFRYIVFGVIFNDTFTKFKEILGPLEGQ
jgi:uncharacterized protein (TIGR02452 family)